MGKPLIATDVPGCREIVDDGKNGFLCKPRDAADLAERMLAMMRLPPERLLAMGAAARAKVEQEFSESIVVARYLSAIDGILERSEESVSETRRHSRRRTRTNRKLWEPWHLRKSSQPTTQPQDIRCRAPD